MAGVAAEVLRGAAPSDPTAVRLVLLTSEWSDPIAEYLYPQLDALVAAAGARGRSIERLELCRGDSDGHTNLADGWSRSAIDAEYDHNEFRWSIYLFVLSLVDCCLQVLQSGVQGGWGDGATCVHIRRKHG